MTPQPSRYLLTIAAAAMLLSAASVSQAQVTTIPTGLNPGDGYRLAFVTSEKISATSTNIATYNAFVTGVADDVEELAALGTTWTTIGSTGTVDARDNNATVPGVAPDLPIYLLDGTLLVNDNADLWDGTIGVVLDVDESGAPIGAIKVWTGSTATGTGYPMRQLGETTFHFSRTGETIFANSAWVECCEFSHFPEESQILPMYALSDVLTVPEPSVIPILSHWGLILLGLLLLATMLVANRRRLQH